MVAVSFLTRIPVPIVVSSDRELASSAPWFPVVGIMVGAVTAAVLTVGAIVFGPLLSAAIAVLVGVGVTGAFHEDGLADTFDGFGGGQTREQRMTIMKDSRLGTFGTVAIICALGVQTLAIADLVDGRGVIWLIVAHVVSRTVALAVMASSQSANEGLGATYLDGLRPIATATGIASGAVISAMVLVVGSASVVQLIGPLITAMFAGVLVRKWSYSKIGGVTGDVLGAVQQVAFTAVLLMAVATTSIAGSGLG